MNSDNKRDEIIDIALFCKTQNEANEFMTKYPDFINHLDDKFKKGICKYKHISIETVFSNGDIDSYCTNDKCDMCSCPISDDDCVDCDCFEEL